MKYSTYPKYKPSGVEWFGDVPEHWQTPPLSMRYECLLGKMLNESRITGKHLVRYIRNVDVQWDRINIRDLPEMDIAPSEIERFTVREGDIVTCEGGEVGRSALVNSVPFTLGFQKAIHRLRPKKRSEFARFQFFVMVAAAQIGAFTAGGNPNTIPHLTGEKLRRHRFPSPPLEEQTAIAGFLDRETGRIDTLISKQRELIELLQEKRRALISRCVTRGLPPKPAQAAGLDPHPKLKQTGIDWLGKIPEHWEVIRLSRKWDVLDCKHKTVSFVDEGIPIASIREVAGFEVDLSNANRTTQEEFQDMIEGGREPQEGDIIYSRNATVGDAAIVRSSQPFCMGQDVCLIRSTHQNSLFTAYLLRSPALLEQAESMMIGSTFRRINVGQIKSFWMTIPTLEEQTAIASYLDTETAKLDQLVSKAEELIDRLHEYRTALITAAVTGKIDVRNEGANNNVGE